MSEDRHTLYIHTLCVDNMHRRPWCKKRKYFNKLKGQNYKENTGIRITLRSSNKHTVKQNKETLINCGNKEKVNPKERIHVIHDLWQTYHVGSTVKQTGNNN